MITDKIISQKCKYALQAVLELAVRGSAEPVKIQDIAAAEGIPARFLEVIMAELKHGGFVESRRGNEGGYILIRPAKEITAGQIIEFLQGKVGKERRAGTMENSDDVFLKVWKEVDETVSRIYNRVNFGELAKEERAKRENIAADYVI